MYVCLKRYTMGTLAAHIFQAWPRFSTKARLLHFACTRSGKKKSGSRYRRHWRLPGATGSSLSLGQHRYLWPVPLQRRRWCIIYTRIHRHHRSDASSMSGFMHRGCKLPARCLSYRPWKFSSEFPTTVSLRPCLSIVFPVERINFDRSAVFDTNLSRTKRDAHWSPTPRTLYINSRGARAWNAYISTVIIDYR